MSNFLEILKIWIVLRYEEGCRSKRRPSGAKGLSIVDGALAMAAVRPPMKHVRFLIESGGDVSVHQWLPLRMAAANGDLDLIAYMLNLCEPSKYAIEDAINWARGKKQVETLHFLQNVQVSLADK